MTKHTTEKPTIGILAFGSLISKPGARISEATFDRHEVEKTPFAVEFGRKSTTRGGAPTLVRVEKGKQVKCEVFAMDPTLCLQKVADLVYSREKHLKNKVKPYKRKIEDYHYKTYNPTEKEIIVSYLPKFEGLSKVLFADFVANLMPTTARELACRAIISVENCKNCEKCRKLEEYYDSGVDGISYLHHALGEGIDTCLSSEYKAEILEMTDDSKCLPEALEKVKGNPRKFVDLARNELNNLKNGARNRSL